MRYIRVFDPAHTSERGLTIRTYRDLSAHPDLVLWTGHVEADGVVVIHDRARTVAAAIPARERADRTANHGDERFVSPETFRAESRLG